MADTWIDRLSEYIDEELPPAERAALETHLASCRECSAALEELREVVARASRLPARPPAADLWPGIEPRVQGAAPASPLRFQGRPARRFSFTLPQLVAAGLALMVMSGGGVWVLQHGGRATSLPPVGATVGEPAAGVAAGLSDPRYDEAVAGLQRAYNAGRSSLDAATLQAFETDLAAIDAAIGETRRALAADPVNVDLNNRLADARQRKLALLRRATALAGGKIE